MIWKKIALATVLFSGFIYFGRLIQFTQKYLTLPKDEKWFKKIDRTMYQMSKNKNATCGGGISLTWNWKWCLMKSIFEMRIEKSKYLGAIWVTRYFDFEVCLSFRLCACVCVCPLAVSLNVTNKSCVVNMY